MGSNQEKVHLLNLLFELDEVKKWRISKRLNLERI
jgi:hypothetical protein